MLLISTDVLRPLVFISYTGIYVIHLTVDENLLLPFYILQSAFHCMCLGYRKTQLYIQSDVPPYIICTVNSSSTMLCNVHGVYYVIYSYL